MNMNELLETLAKYNCQVENKDGKIIITPKNDEQPKQPKFKRGDILWSEYFHIFCVFDCLNYYKDTNELTGFFKSLFHTREDFTKYEDFCWATDKFTLATEKQLVEFNDKLAKEGKQWNAEKCELEDLKWKPKKYDSFYFPSFDAMLGIFIPYFLTNRNDDDELKIFHNWYIFKTEEECKKKCNELNDAINNVK